MREGEPGRAWLDQLPAMFRGLLEKWELHRDGPPLHGVTAVVVPVRLADGGCGALKVAWIDDETRDEAVALRAWAGRSAVSLLRCEEPSGALLLERLDERRTLLDRPVGQALDIAATVLKELRVPAVEGLRTTHETAARWSGEFLEDWQRLGRPCGEALMTAAVQLCLELSISPAEPTIVHGDFHYANILGRGDLGWAAIDPKPLSGDPAYDVVSLLRNRWTEIRGGDPTNVTIQRRVKRFADVAGLDLGRTYKWCLVRSVDDALWFQEKGSPDLAEISWDITTSMHECLCR